MHATRLRPVQFFAITIAYAIGVIPTYLFIHQKKIGSKIPIKFPTLLLNKVSVCALVPVLPQNLEKSVLVKSP